jgi:TonB-dependent receptor
MHSQIARSLRLFVALLVVVRGTALAQNATTSVTGTVTDSVTKAPLAGALVTVEGTALSAATDQTGTFRITAAPVGAHVLLVTYLGHADQRAAVDLRASETRTVDVAMSRTAFSETVQVTAETIDEGQSRALNQQKTAANIINVVAADQIGSFPDPNAAEAASRIPGVSIARDQGEGRYILIRGTEARLNSVMIDGERIPSPEDTRQIMLDAVPADQLQSIELSKAVTPDMDADSIGGAVNLITKQAVGRPTMLFSLAGGYNGLQQDYGQQLYTGTLGRRFAGGRFGLLVGGSASSLHRGSENFEARYAAGNLADLQLRDYQIHRERYGVNVSADTKLANGGSLTIRSIFNEFRDYEINNRERFRPPNSRIEHVLKNRHQADHIRSVSAAGQHLLRSGTTLDYRLAWAKSREDQPDRLDTIFRQSGVIFSPNVSASSIDPENIQPNPSSDNAAIARLNTWATQIFDSNDRDITGSFNVRTPLGAGGASARFLKFGIKIKDKQKDNELAVTTGSPASVVLFPQLQDTGFDNSRFLDFFPAVYPKFPGINADASRAMFNALPSSRISIDHEADAEDYRATERLYAGYVMAELYIGDKLLVLPGVRYESTKVDYTGNRVLYDEGGGYISTQPVPGGDTHGFLLPGFHVKYAFTPASNLRVAYTRTLARPNYYDLVPYQLVFQEDGEISRGNASLRPTTSNNLDVLVERYFRSVGLVSAGVFYKRLNDYVFPFRFREAAFGDTYQVTQPRNGDSASLWGVELAFQNQLRFLPRPFDGLGLYANLTLTDSSAEFPARGATSTLPGQSSRLGNLAIWYEKHGFSARSSWNFHGKYIDAVGDSAATDVYYDNHVQWDLSFSQRLVRQAKAYVDVLNLTNAPLRYYEGTTNRPIQEEYYRSWVTFGVKFNF